MSNAGYTTLTRQAGLMQEMQLVAHNLANLSTTGYRGEGVLFSEYVVAQEGSTDSLSMATANVRRTDTRQGPLTQTGGSFDFAIEGPGYFMIRTASGDQLTRAGSFTPNENGELVTPDGYHLLDAGGAPIFIPPDATSIGVAADGTLSADGRPLSQVGLYEPIDPMGVSREGGTRFRSDAGVEPVLGSTILQGFIEDSNVDPVREIARMIEVQRAYELGQSFLDKEDERVRAVLQTISR